MGKSVKYTNLAPNLNVEIARIDKDQIENNSYATTKFCLKKLRIQPYTYQHLFFKTVWNNKKVVVCKPRQVGFSTAIAILSSDFCINNRFPSGIFKNTKIGIVSRSDKQSKKLLRDIRRLMDMADSFDANKPFENAIDAGRFVPRNMYEINFKNRSFIKCFPPTDAVRGETFDVVFVDEAGDVDDEVYYECIEPTISKTNGKIVIVSTPKGQRGFFFELFDPFDKFEKHDFTRLWFFWKQCEDPVQKREIEQKYYVAKKTGRLRSFDQEYNALFTVDEEAFFEDADVDKGWDRSLAPHYEWKKSRCVLAVDYGMVNAQTVLTVKTRINEKVVTLFQFGDFELDDNLLMDTSFEHSIPNLMKRYDIFKIVTDDCPQGYRTNKELETKGYPVQKIYFSSGVDSKGTKHKMYYGYRTMLKKGIIKYYNIPELFSEMKSLMEIRMKITTSIEKSKGSTDDRIDSEVMATYPFIDDDGVFESFLIEAPKQNSVNVYNNKRSDPEWEGMVHAYKVEKEIGGVS